MRFIEIFGIILGVYYFGGISFLIYEVIREEWLCPNPFIKLRDKYFPLPSEELENDVDSLSREESSEEEKIEIILDADI